MLRYYSQNINLLLFYFLIVILGAFTGPAAYAVVPAIFIYYYTNKKAPYLLFAFFFVLLLSDSRQYFFGFAEKVKPVIVVLLCFLYYIDYRTKSEKINFTAPFTLFFLVACFCLKNSSTFFNSTSKTISYFLILFTIPGLTSYLLVYHKEKLLKGLVYFGAFVLGAGLVLRLIYPAITNFKGERFSGLLGNPNGLGIFCFLFFTLLIIIVHYYPLLISRTDKILIYGLILVSLVLSGSRGGIFSILIFIAFYIISKRSRLLAILTVAILALTYTSLEKYLPEIIEAFGQEKYFRLQTLETGSGRNVAFEFAWENIQKDLYSGKGLGYTEKLMKDNEDELSEEGHQGNAHNSYLTMWLDTGLFGLLAFIFGWGYWFFKANKFSFFAMPVAFAVLFSSNVESWLAASLNPFTIQLLIILTLLNNREFIYGNEKKASLRSA
jgi:O-antigen ligase